MALESTDIDAALSRMADSIRQLRDTAKDVKRSTNLAVSELSQLATTYSETISAVSGLAGSPDPVDRLQVAKLAKIIAEAGALYTKVLAVKTGIDQLGL